MSALYPLALQATSRELIWGGRALVERFGKTGSPEANIGESWECWDENRIANGPLQGNTIAELRASLGTQLTGSSDPHAIFPLLTKIIDARHALSVQVHPPDDYAKRVEHQPSGKTECWHVLDADEGASIELGWNRETTRAEIEERVAGGSLESLLRRIAVKPGDTFFLPAGTVHAIGAGIVLYEVQQASDLTYRLYDYHRKGPDGRPRELHVAKALDVLHYGADSHGVLDNVTYQLDGLARTALVACDKFILERVVAVARPGGIDLDGAPLVVQALAKPVELEAKGERTILKPYESALVPAGVDVVMLRANDDTADVLTAAPAGDRYALERRFARASAPVAETSEFFAQF